MRRIGVIIANMSRECTECHGFFLVPSTHKARIPRYCSPECRRKSRNRQTQAIRRHLSDHGLCTRCKQPIPRTGG